MKNSELALAPEIKLELESDFVIVSELWFKLDFQLRQGLYQEFWLELNQELNIELQLKTYFHF